MSSRSKILFFDHIPGADYQDASGDGLGSSLFKLAALSDARDQGYEVHLLTDETKAELLSGAEGIDFICSDPDDLNFKWFDKVINLGIPDEEIPEYIKTLDYYHSYSEANKKAYKMDPHLRFWRSYTANALDYEVPRSKSNIELVQDTLSLKTAAELMPNRETWIAIPCQTVSPLKDFEEWREVIKLLLDKEENVRIVLLGDIEQEFKTSDRVLNLTGKTNISLLKAVVSRASVVVGVDGLVTNLALSLEIPAVILFTMISPENVIDDLFSGKVTPMVSKGCPFQFCYKDIVNYRNSGCHWLAENPQENQPLCLGFSAEEIAKTTIHYLD